VPTVTTNKPRRGRDTVEMSTGELFTAFERWLKRPVDSMTFVTQGGSVVGVRVVVETPR
jgi:hypothetical protein